MATYPQDADVELIIADDVRHELGNKISVMGWYVGGDIVVSTPDAIMPFLTFLFVARGGGGHVEWSVRITPSTGMQVSTPTASAELEPSKPLVQAVKFFNIPLPVGTYSVELCLNDRRYERQFSVRAVS